MSTIFAVSSGRLPAAIAVMRISGPAARAAGEALAGALPAPRRAALRTLRDAEGAVLDRALCLWFPGPATATGEDLLELHVHGGRAVVAAIEATLGERPGLRAAEPGEFTRRALAAGRIDLSEAQGLADLLAAETEQQRRAAIRSSEGHVGALVRGWMARLSALGAMIEASIDFDDEEDVAAADKPDVQAIARIIAGELREVLARPAVERLTEGVRVVLSGPPNAGKSSLFNALLRREAAIVAPVAGTTRDTIEARVTRDGAIYTLVDTAGLRPSTSDPVEHIGIERARRESDAADLVLWLGDDPPESSTALWLFPRSDLPGRETAPRDSLGVSAYDAHAIEQIWQAIAERTRETVPYDSAILHRQQQDSVALAAKALELEEFGDPLLHAEAVRVASQSLGAILGVNATEAMLDDLFSRFCIGK